MAALADSTNAADLTEKDLKRSLASDAKAMNNMEGKDKKGDVHVETMASAMEALIGMIPAEDFRFEYQSLHLGKGLCEGYTKDHVHRAFLLWSQKPSDREIDSFNVSKAFRRLTAFADYTTEMFDKYFTEPVDMDASDIVAASRLMEILILQETDPATGAVVWIMDLSAWDMRNYNDIESVGTSHRSIMRWLFALMLRGMWDDNTLVNGVIIIEAFGNVGMRGMLKTQGLFKPIEDDLNKMFYGVMPFKLKCCILVGAPWWLSALIAFMRLFISKKMSQRIKNLSDADVVRQMGGVSCLPIGFLGGTRPYEPRYPGFALRKSSGAGDTAAAEEEEQMESKDVLL